MANPLPDPGWWDPLASRNGLVMRSRSIALLPIGFVAREPSLEMATVTGVVPPVQ
ncbi:hypothetical protein [Mycobacterium sp.]|uniref:hypothetical protein n=1 Tax=Mycobacterium sp. TaxID=1785 RepID=UPI003F9962B0